MNFNLMPFIVLLGALALAVLLLIAYRKVVSSHEDDSLHVSGPANAVPDQAAMAAKLETIDRWGKLLTVVTVVYGIVLGAIYLYKGWIDANTASMGK